MKYCGHGNATQHIVTSHTTKFNTAELIASRNPRIGEALRMEYVASGSEEVGVNQSRHMKVNVMKIKMRGPSVKNSLHK